MTGDVAIEVEDLRKAYGEHEAVRGISFAVRRGEVFGLLGPNGAGKTTTVEILEGFRARSGGRVAVLGHGPRRAAARAARADRDRAPVRGPVPAPDRARGRPPLGRALPHAARRRGDDPAGGLEASADKRTQSLSGGQQRRLDFALALVGDPDLIFLDEPTTGFDPAARRQAWDTIRSLQQLGKTVLLTTHYLDEAQALADRVAIIKDGTILAEGPPGELGSATRRYRVAWRDADGTPHERETEDPTRLLHELTGAALARGERLHELSVSQPSLEDVYLELTSPEPAAA